MLTSAPTSSRSSHPVTPISALAACAFTSSSNGGYELIEFRGFVDADNGDFTPTYRLEFDPDRTPTEEDFFDTITKNAGTFSSRWYMQLGFRYTF